MGEKMDQNKEWLIEIRLKKAVEKLKAHGFDAIVDRYAHHFGGSKAGISKLLIADRRLKDLGS
jgi:hypothetical protein